MAQIALPLDWPVADGDEDFLLSESNAQAFEHLKRWSTWPVMASLLTGPRKSGRSLLGRIFVRKTGGRLFDNAERHDEEAIFHAWNEAQEKRRPLLIVADAAAIAQAEIAVSRVRGVTSAITASQSIGGTSTMRVTFSGDGAALQAALEAQGWTVSGSGTSLRISR